MENLSDHQRSDGARSVGGQNCRRHQAVEARKIEPRRATVIADDQIPERQTTMNVFGFELMTPNAVAKAEMKITPTSSAGSAGGDVAAIRPSSFLDGQLRRFGIDEHSCRDDRHHRAAVLRDRQLRVDLR